MGVLPLKQQARAGSCNWNLNLSRSRSRVAVTIGDIAEAADVGVAAFSHGRRAPGSEPQKPASNRSRSRSRDCHVTKVAEPAGASKPMAHGASCVAWPPRPAGPRFAFRSRLQAGDEAEIDLE
eukprot:NODE_24240_length_633_cov_0.709486.p2 GENE.NODE_24240_length_633_cov_0.709486~~NODE_24240_length_633_cov_0.709486.p2  ORF type:complete len:123 (-),score=8.04 NODE_24240_length_633_cov_0.709486:263-631(-)